MAKSYQQLQQKLHFDELMRWLDGEFQELPEHRASNTRYALADVLKSTFAMFSLKAPSLLDFKKQSQTQENNLPIAFKKILLMKILLMVRGAPSRASCW
jgi:hypothetical protein